MGRFLNESHARKRPKRRAEQRVVGRQRQADPPGPCVTGRGRTRSHSTGRSEATARPPQRFQPISTAHRSSTVFVFTKRPKFCGHGFPGGVCSLVWERGRGRVQGSSFSRHFTAVDFELGPGRPPWPPWLLPGLQAQSGLRRELGWARALHCLRCRLQGRRWPRWA